MKSSFRKAKGVGVNTAQNKSLKKKSSLDKDNKTSAVNTGSCT